MRPFDPAAADTAPGFLEAALEGLAGLAGDSSVVVMIQRKTPTHKNGVPIAGMTSLRFNAPFQGSEVVDSIGRYLGGGDYLIKSQINGRWGPTWPLSLPGEAIMPRAGQPGAWGRADDNDEGEGSAMVSTTGGMLEQLREDVRTARDEAARERKDAADERDKRRTAENALALSGMRLETATAEKTRLDSELRDVKSKLEQLDREQRAASTELATLRAAGPKSSPFEDYAKIHALLNKGAAAEPGKQMMDNFELLVGKMLPRLVAAHGGGEPAGGWADFAKELAGGLREGFARMGKGDDDEDEDEPKPIKSRVVESRRFKPREPAGDNGHVPGAGQAPPPAAASPAPPAKAAEPDDDEEEDTNVIATHVLADIRAQIAAGMDGRQFAGLVLEATPEERANMFSVMVLKACAQQPPETVYKYALTFASPAEKTLLEGDAARRWFLSFAQTIYDALHEAAPGAAPAPERATPRAAAKAAGKR